MRNSIGELTVELRKLVQIPFACHYDPIKLSDEAIQQ
jgi:hypothetical protein